MRAQFVRFLVICICLLTMRRVWNRRNRPASFNPKAMSVAELQGLPKNTLVLLVSARKFITTGSKAQLAQRAFELEHGESRRSATIAVSPNADSIVTVASIKQTINQPFSRGQLTQLRPQISKVVGSEQRAPVLASPNPTVPLLFPHKLASWSTATATRTGRREKPRWPVFSSASWSQFPSWKRGRCLDRSR